MNTLLDGCRWGAGLDKILERDEVGDDGEDGEPGETDRSAKTFLVNTEGDTDRFGGEIVRAADVAWCRNVGGEVAITFAFARLAAMAAATLVFFAAGVTGITAPSDSGFGHAFSSCLRFIESCASSIA